MVLKAQKYIPSEKELENSIIDYLRLRGIFCWKNNSVGIFDSTKKTFRKKSKRELNGVSDILGILPNGKFLAIEVKKPKVKARKDWELKKLASDDQNYFIHKINKSGGVAFVADSLDLVIEKLKLN